MDVHPLPQNRVAQLVSMIREKGFIGSASAIRSALALRAERRSDSAWDRQYGLDTCGVTHLSQLKIDSENVAQGVEYDPSPIRTIRSLLGRLPTTAGYTFVDFGSGKGRVLFVAAELGFERIVGVEFAPQLHEAAMKNLESFRKAVPQSPPIDLVLGDAVRFEIPRGPCLLYFYTPFKAELLRKVLANVAASYRSDPRPMIVGYAYVIPYHIDQYSAIPGFGELPTRKRWADLIRPPRVHLRLFASPEAGR